MYKSQMILKSCAAEWLQISGLMSLTSKCTSQHDPNPLIENDEQQKFLSFLNTCSTPTPTARLCLNPDVQISVLSQKEQKMKDSNSSWIIPVWIDDRCLSLPAIKSNL